MNPLSNTPVNKPQLSGLLQTQLATLEASGGSLAALNETLPPSGYLVAFFGKGHWPMAAVFPASAEMAAKDFHTAVQIAVASEVMEGKFQKQTPRGIFLNLSETSIAVRENWPALERAIDVAVAEAKPGQDIPVPKIGLLSDMYFAKRNIPSL